jgi:hypothetical protein
MASKTTVMQAAHTKHEERLAVMVSVWVVVQHGPVFF